MNGKLPLSGLVGAQVYLCVRFLQNHSDVTASNARVTANGLMCVGLFVIIFLAWRQMRVTQLAYAEVRALVVMPEETPQLPRREARALDRRLAERHRHSAEDVKLITADDEAEHTSRSAWAARRDQDRARWSVIAYSELRPWLRPLLAPERHEVVQVLGRCYDQARRFAA